MNILYLPVGRKTFDLQSANEKRTNTSSFLNKLNINVIEPKEILTEIESLKTFITNHKNESASLIVYQNATFTDAQFIQTIINKLRVPIIVWSVREPSVGGRLRLNSLTGGNSASHYLRSENHPFTFIYGDADENQTQEQFKQKLKVHKTLDKLKSIKIGLVGEHPPGFFFSDTDEELLSEKIGTKIEKFDLHEAFEKSKQIEESEYAYMIEKAKEQVIGINKNDHTVKRFAQFSAHLDKKIKERKITALAIRCWPDFFTELGAAACSTLSQFTEDGVVSSCESDIHGAISMFILRELSKGSAPYLGDLVHVDEEANSGVLWHCGAGAYSLAHPSRGAQSGVHPNRKLGFTMDFGLKPGTVTLFRLSYTKKDGYRFLIIRGKALDTPQRFDGTSVEVEFETDVKSTLYNLMHEGFEPHYALVYADIVEELVELGRYLNVETKVYTK